MDRPSPVARLVAACCARPRLTAIVGLLIGAIAAGFAATHFAITTSTDALLSPKLDWRQREAAYDRLFPQHDDEIVVVVDGKTPELAEEAAASLAAKLSAQPALFTRIQRPDGGDFFAREGLLYLPLKDVQDSTAQMIKAQPFLGPMAADPSLRGLMGGLSTALTGIKAGQANLADLDAPIAGLGEALGKVEAGQPSFFSWRALVSGKAPEARELRHILLVKPKLDYAALQPGDAAESAIRAQAKALNLDAAHGVSVRLTGDVPLQDEEFGSLADRAALIGALAVAAILLMLWMAVRSPRIIGCILVTTFVGLVVAAAWGLLVFHRYNVISVAFIPLFVGLGIDFGIQFSVRFRSDYADERTLPEALVEAGQGMGYPLTLAAVAIAVGFLAFVPTNYAGVSQLGVIAGVGMLIALALNLTLLPALLLLTRPKRGGGDIGHAPLEKLDGWVLGNRRLVLGTAALAALGSAALLPLLHFDFNPMHLRSAATESVSTLNDLTKDPDQTPNTLSVLAPNLAAAQPLAARLAKLPAVADVITLQSLIPDGQAEKLAAITDADTLLDLTLNPISTSPPPSDAEVAASLAQTAADLRTAAGSALGAPQDHARRLASLLDTLAKGPSDKRKAAEAALIPGLNTLLDQMRASLQAQPVTLDSLPEDLKRDWIAADGQARISVVPKGDSNDNATLERFTAAVTKIAPDANGPPISIQNGGNTVVGAFIEAGVLSFIAITALLFLVLRRTRDVAITMAPIVLTGLLTLGSCVLIGQPLNFANIIALPLLFGIGVAFHIYFVMAWRAGSAHLLQSSLSRAIFFSALTTATGFGSLWASSHPGTASMGKLLMISLIWTLVSALLFQPALMGPPDRRTSDARDPLHAG
ncbi:hopanoid transporter HpnN [Phenylobacterium montanum]|uniref:MMPL family transporter n=1 Tax=Phenylobacterium montanum TaxID=2823693 RepID=A0A975FWM5_9CAUL|nr:MMPL family transporter [Caulobacter sp. S6]QUD86168.1 MMPL family transporter [Caulobacter sp. S6]